MNKCKRTAVITFLLVLVVMATACGGTKNTSITPSPSPSQSWAVYENKEHGFSMEYPTGWEVNVTGEARKYAITIKDTEDRLTAEVDVEYRSSDAVLSEYVSRVLSITSGLPGYKLISEKDVTLSGNIPGHEVVGKVQDEGGKVQEFRYIFVVKGEQRFIAGVSGEPDYFDQQKTLIDTIIGSYKLLSAYAYVPPAVDPVTTYRNVQYGFTLTYTEGWQEMAEKPQGIIVEIAFEGMTPFIDIDVSTEKQGITLTEFAALAKGTFSTMWTEYQIIGEGGITLDDGTPAYKIILTGTAKGHQFTVKGVFVIRGTQVFLVMGYDLPTQFDKNEAALDKVINSFHLE